MKLYPPIIEGTIPAFCNQKIVVPFTMNKSVSEKEVKDFKLKIKTVQSGYQPFLTETIQMVDWNTDTNEVSFLLPGTLNIGQFYKIQMAYVDTSNIIGYYSTVGIVKYTSDPVISILEPKNGNTYEGLYSQKAINDEDIRDYTEKVYSYNFTLKDAFGNIIETSGDQLHNNSEDVFLYESRDSYTIKTDLEQDKIYYLDYTVKTINGLVKSAQTKHISQIGSIDSKLHTKLECNLDYENGYIDINLVKPDGVQIEESAVGSFYLLRASDEDDFNSWHEVLKFVLQGQQPSRHLWKDMTIKQGVKYKYAIQQFNTYGLRSNKIESNVVEANFEHAFLYDGERQLKIKYNPKVSSFKTTLLESKVDTIGSKHPFIFRNGNVGYKEFPISGLISYLSDENDLFYSTSQNFNEKELYRLATVNQKFIKVIEWITETVYLKNKKFYYYKDGSRYIKWIEYIKNKYPNLDPNSYDDVRIYLSEAFLKELIYQEKEIIDNIKPRTTNLTSDNIYLERNFKLEVLEWLNNGKPKVFRSPTEGNYIVRLMNVSLTPNDTLGRMIHTFNCTAYEIAENDYENLEKYNFIKTNATIQPSLRWLSVDLSANKIENNKNLLKFIASSIYLEDLTPGEKLNITTLEGKDPKTYTIMIGATGRYIIDLSNNVQILNISFKDSENNNEVYHQGMLTYSYYSDEFKDSFDTVNEIANNMIPCQQFIGEHENIIAEIETVKDKIDSIGFIRFTLRNDDIEVYRFNNKYYSDRAATDEIDLVDLMNIYKVNILDKNKNIIDYEWFDGYNNKSLGKDCKDEDTKIIINESDEESIDIKDTTYYELRAVPAITSIKTGAAIITEICYSKKTIGYDLEQQELLTVYLDNGIYYNDQTLRDEINKVELNPKLSYQIYKYNEANQEWDITIIYGENKNVVLARTEYIKQRQKLSRAILNATTSRTKLKELQDKCRTAYLDYNDTLNIAIQEAERR